MRNYQVVNETIAAIQSSYHNIVLESYLLNGSITGYTQ